MRILVFGGSFDPPHRGHALLLAAAAKKILPDRILIVPAFHAPLKGAPSAAARERLILARLGLKDALRPVWRSRTMVLDWEAKARRRVFTVETLTRLLRKHPGELPHVLVGSDSAANFGRWKEHERLKTMAVWWSGTRPGAAGSIPAHFRSLPEDFPDVSSTRLRRDLALGRPTGDRLLPAVRARIQERGLYGTQTLARLRKALKPSRYAHTLCVAELAEELAERHGVDPIRARLAGLLHDIGRRMSPWELPAYCRRRGLAVPSFEKTAAFAPMLLHAYASADIARREFGVADPVVLSAIRKHTLGGPFMTRLDRVLYTADACSCDRAYRGAAALRARARRDLDGAFRACVKAKLDHARASGGWIHPLTETLWKSLAAR